MPYIKQELRKKLKENIDTLWEEIYDLDCTGAEIKGVMNYVITKLITSAILKDSGLLSSENGWKYHTLCDVIGTLECAKLEIYRRLVGPYEDKAIEKNDDLPEFLDER